MTPCCSGNRSISRNIAVDRPFFTENDDEEVIAMLIERKTGRNNEYDIPIVVGVRVADYDWRR